MFLCHACFCGFLTAKSGSKSHFTFVVVVLLVLVVVVLVVRNLAFRQSASSFLGCEPLERFN